jgi:hypothetical protein
VSHWFQMRDQVPGRYTRSFIWNLNQYAGWNFAGDRLWSGGNVNMHWTWQNYYSTSVGFNINGAPTRDRVTRGGPAVKGNSNLATWYGVGTDNRKSVSAYYNGYYENDRNGTVRFNVAPSVTWRPSPPGSGTTSITTMRSG